MDDRLCINCQHCQRPPRSSWGGAYLCVRPVGAVHSRVTGSAQRKLFVRCESERHGTRSLTRRLKCGGEGRYFEERKPLPGPLPVSK